jgi:hypothetical protein
MKIDDKYTTNEKIKKEPEKEKGKTVVTNDAYLLGEAIDNLINKIEHARRSLM